MCHAQGTVWLDAPRRRCKSPRSMYTPSKADFVAAASRGNLIPVYRELCADGDTPVSAYAALGGGDYSFLLESVVGGATWAAYSFVGVAPRAVLVCEGGTARVTWFDVDGAGAAALLGRRGRLDRVRLRPR